MRNKKIDPARIAVILGKSAGGFRFTRLPRHTPRDTMNLQSYDHATHKRRLKNRVRNRLARLSRRRNRHG